MKEYEIYVPLTHNDGAPVAPEKLVQMRELKEQLKRDLEQEEILIVEKDADIL